MSDCLDHSFLPSLSLSTHSDYPLWCLMQEVPRMVFAFSRFMFDKEEESFPGDSVVKKSTHQYRRLRFHPWVRKILWRRKWQPPPVFLPGESHGQRSLAGYSSWGHKRLRHDLATTEQGSKTSLNVYKCFRILSTLKI